MSGSSPLVAGRPTGYDAADPVGDTFASSASPPPPTGDALVDVHLMRAIAAGDREAMSDLYDRYAARLMGFLVRMLGDRGDAEETLAELYFEVWDRADRYDLTRGCVATYLMTLARSRAIDKRRRRAARPDRDPSRVVPVDAADNDPTANAAAITPLAGVLFDEQAAVVRSALSKLEDRQREAIELSYFDGLSHTEIADRLSRPLGTVKTWIRLGLGRLRDSLKKYETHG